MEVEGHQTGSTEESKVEGQVSTPSITELQAELTAQKATNERLLAQSKENADKYRSIRDKNSAREKLELEQSENWKERLEVEKTEKLKVKERFENLKRTSLRKDLNFEVAKMIGNQPLNEGVSIDDVIHQVMETGLIEVNDSEDGFNNLSDAYAKVKESKQFLFNSSKKPMINSVPSGNSPKERQLTKDELFRKAIGAIHKK